MSRRIGACGFALALIVSLFVISCGSDFYQEWAGDPPQPPRGLKALIVGDDLEISWECVQGASHYTLLWGREMEVYRSLKDTPTCSVALTGLRRGDFYRFAVTAWNNSGESDPSKVLDYVFDDDPGRAEHYVAKGDEAVRKGLYHDAHAYFSTAIRLDPNNAVAYRRRAAVNAKLYRMDLAKQDDEAAAKISAR